MEYRSRSLLDALEEPVRRRRHRPHPHPHPHQAPPADPSLWELSEEGYVLRRYEGGETELPWNEIRDGLRLSCWKGIQWLFGLR